MCLVQILKSTQLILLYSASLKDLRFVRIGENIRPSYNSSIEPCIAVETFDRLPGVLIMNQERAYNEHQMIFTAISFNYGLKWTHIVPPKIIKDLSCIWVSFQLNYVFKPSCYLKLTLECQNNNKRNSIKFNKKSPSLMISYGNN
ncbi:hypothetical protein HZS_5704 [Henneguya salminicola]|nr:hypothetical protein HZS_5704 [Henneguya salminicola]